MDAGGGAPRVGALGAKSRPLEGTHGAVAEDICWPEGKNRLELAVKQGNIQARAAEFSGDFVVIRAKSQANAWSITVDFMEKGFNSYYTHIDSIESRHRYCIRAVGNRTLGSLIWCISIPAAAKSGAGSQS